MSRHPDFHKNVLSGLNQIMLSWGVSRTEAVILAAQFAGLAVADLPGTSEIQTAQLDVAARAMKTAWFTKRFNADQKTAEEFYKDGA